MATTPKEIDPKIAELVLAGLLDEIRSGRSQILVAEKIPYRGGETTYVIKVRDCK